MIFTRITKYYPTPGSKQDWGILGQFDGKDVESFLIISRFLEKIGLLDDVKTPNTTAVGESKEFYENYDEIIDAMADLSRD